ncbi:MAG: TonB family protein [Acidobacteria bacterium]|nr:TonB family protein [Acidobacteriota bacterium]
MARIGVNIIIEKRKTLEPGGRTFSVISVLLHIVVGLIVVLGVLVARNRVLREPKVYRVSIATLATVDNTNTEVKKAKVVTEKPQKKIPEKQQTKPAVKTVVRKKHPVKPARKKIVGLNTEKHQKKIKPAPATKVESRLQPVASGGPKRVGFSGHGTVFDVDGANFEYSYYLSIVQDRIGRNWERSYIGKGKVKVFFRIERDGSIVGAMIEISSGDVGLDRLALRAVTASSPLPPLPEGYTGKNLGIHILFNYEE